MNKITYENFNDSQTKAMLDALIKVGTAKYRLKDQEGLQSEKYIRFSRYERAMLKIFHNDVLDKITKDEVILLFNYVDMRYQNNLKDEESDKYLSEMLNELRYEFAKEIDKDNTNLFELVKTLSKNTKTIN